MLTIVTLQATELKKEITMITDAEILKLVMERYPEQHMQFIVEQFSSLKAGIIQANTKLAANNLVMPEPEAVCEASEPVAVEEAEVQEAPRKKFSKRDLKVKPAESITEETIKCCLCGKELRSLTSRHLAGHGISVEDYKKLCGFDPDSSLMSHQQYSRMRQNIEKALAAKNRDFKK